MHVFVAFTPPPRYVHIVGPIIISGVPGVDDEPDTGRAYAIRGHSPDLPLPSRCPPRRRRRRHRRDERRRRRSK